MKSADYFYGNPAHKQLTGGTNRLVKGLFPKSGLIQECSVTELAPWGLLAGCCLYCFSHVSLIVLHCLLRPDAAVYQDKVEIYPAQAFDQDLYKLSIQLFRQDRERRPSTASAPPVVPLPTAAVH